MASATAPGEGGVGDAGDVSAKGRIGKFEQFAVKGFGIAGFEEDDLGEGAAGCVHSPKLPETATDFRKTLTRNLHHLNNPLV